MCKELSFDTSSTSAFLIASTSSPMRREWSVQDEFGAREVDICDEIDQEVMIFVGGYYY